MRELFDPRIEGVLKPDRAAFYKRDGKNMTILMLRYFLHHMGFYFLNILWLPVMLVFEGFWWTLNAGFWTWNIVMDNLYSLSAIGQIAMLYQYREEYKLPIILSGINFFSITVRSFKISVRYGLIDVDLLKDFKSKWFPPKELFNYLLVGWMMAGPKVIDREIWYSI